ncbi:Holliday junction branch migration DNA helicase RuvB [Leptospira biflexa]|uniref:Holliday junction branch migration complex subunit RuvB n=2 Tax=Leptospira biflexa TaxID=172 RepID=B0SJG2_LEPBP|nr:Holliday junction DNA helicase [Leptospira biflexa serovar Patoc strain 'Patoc 1 (Ames)']ABZ96662.1 Holliday junction DNA helicase RuvB [Leptospira biflexa serovar Patoc strain 'Patoc 1 (Paris)']TGM47483.1 Holliday junction branch migration DNA helicase RuvB [Leptospira biflexa]TGM50051.1 Holliday junction branch migration DNA helicase RuvB [Leptospira biflexa]
MSLREDWMQAGEEEPNLRPTKLSEFIGQKEVLANLSVYVEAARKRKSPLDHVLISGPPGLGKTTLANIIANELAVAFTPTSAPAISKGADLVRFLTLLKTNEVLFIDEIHGFIKKQEELLYPAMENFFVDLVVGEGVTANALQIQLQPFTLVGATTRSGLVSDPLKSRFGIHLKLDFYTDEEMQIIVDRSAKLLGVELGQGVAMEVGKRSRKTPRIANHLLKRVRDFAEVNNETSVSLKTCRYAFDRMGVDHLGLDAVDRQILDILISRYGGGPVGIKPIAVVLGEEERTIEDTYEPFLVRVGLIDRTPQGRVATKKAYEHLGLPYIGNTGENRENGPTLF